MVGLVSLSLVLGGQVAQPKFPMPDRLDAALRVRRVEEAWLKASDAEKQAAIPHINNAVMGFFSGIFGEVSGHLDAAHTSLTGQKKSEWDRFGLRVFPTIYAPGQKVYLEAYRLYGEPWRDDLVVTFEGQQVRFSAGGSYGQEVQTIERKASKPGAFGQAFVTIEGKDFPINAYWSNHADKRDYPNLSDPLLKAQMEPGFFFGREALGSLLTFVSRPAPKPGDPAQWYASEKNTTIFRINTKKLISGKVKVLIALHGAGGSENMFPEGYGAGRFVQGAADRGWVVLSPRATPSAVRDCLEWLVSDRKVEIEKLVVAGHSMGGGLALNAARAQKLDGLIMFAPAGQGSVPEIPTFLGVGAKEIAMLKASADRMGATLADRKDSTFKVYPNAEHLMIVAEATADALKFLDGL